MRRVETDSYSASLIPPDERARGDIGPGDFRAIGEQFLEHFRELGGLKRTDRVLDVGCGSGRMAAPLTVFLDPSRGSYEGFDVTESGLSWCRDAYRAHPNFHFQRARIRSDIYAAPEGCEPTEYRFPYEDGGFDFVFLTSVFTHLLPDAVAHYLHGVYRVLRSGGACLATYYLIDVRSIRASHETPGAIKFQRFVPHQPVWVVDPDRPEAVVAYEIDHVLKLYDRSGFGRFEVSRGRWPVVFRVLMPEARSFQDIVVARKP